MPTPLPEEQLERGLGLTEAVALNMNAMVGIGPFIVIPLVIQAMGGPQCLLAWLAGAPSFARLLAVEVWFAMLYATYNGAMAPLLIEIMLMSRPGIRGTIRECSPSSRSSSTVRKPTTAT